MLLRSMIKLCRMRTLETRPCKENVELLLTLDCHFSLGERVGSVDPGIFDDGSNVDQSGGGCSASTL